MIHAVMPIRLCGPQSASSYSQTWTGDESRTFLYKALAHLFCVTSVSKSTDDLTTDLCDGLLPLLPGLLHQLNASLCLLSSPRRVRSTKKTKPTRQSQILEATLNV